jgi:hypothetical protein
MVGKMTAKIPLMCPMERHMNGIKKLHAYPVYIVQNCFTLERLFVIADAE